MPEQKRAKGIYQKHGAGDWLFDIQINGHRFSGSTHRANRREAERWIKEYREAKKSEIAEFDGTDRPMTFGVASTRWWTEKGQHRKDARNIEWSLAWLQREIGKSRRISTINNNLIAQLVARRQAQDVTPATVNRSMTEPLRAILTRARDTWGQRVSSIEWKSHKLKEPQERIREMNLAEEEAVFANLRRDFIPIARFLLIMGLRRAEACNLEWQQVDFGSSLLTVNGKGDTVHVLPIPSAAMAILRSLQGQHDRFVFTYVAKHKWSGVRKGTRVPIAPDTLGTAYWRARKAAGVENLKLHDFRHTAATRMMRKVGNIKTVQRMLRHQRITTTARYAHVTNEDLRAAMEATNPVAVEIVTDAQSPGNSPVDQNPDSAMMMKSKENKAQ